MWRDATYRVCWTARRDTQQKRKCGAFHSLAENSQANVSSWTIRILFWLVHYTEIVTILLTAKNVINTILRESNLNQIGSLWRKMTINDDGHVEIWAQHRKSRHVTTLSCLSWQAKWNLGYRIVRWSVIQIRISKAQLHGGFTRHFGWRCCCSATWATGVHSFDR